jgi:hypothetical protein
MYAGKQKCTAAWLAGWVCKLSQYVNAMQSNIRWNRQYTLLAGWLENVISTE